MEMSAGKSKVLMTTALCFNKGVINGLLPITPKGVYKKGMKRDPKHLPDHIEKKMVFGKVNKSGEQTEKLNTFLKQVQTFMY